MTPRTLQRLTRGFTLVELMIVVVIASILLSVAVPSYITSMRKSRRSDAKTALLDLAGREERYLSTNPAGYSNTPADLGLAGIGVANPIGTSQYYYISAICVTAAGAASACPPSTLSGPSFLITVLPMAGTTQAGDTQCTSFSVDSGGRQFSTGTLATAQCWSN
ncbi:MAG: prepilin-type N-terminal cleavage/methylation domain-containing protein [Proteobacteria bacterium]|nr:prepilin-type N-terminal cleavage/methylation domain-containing protein [Pseudomonadota bacterium]